MSRAERRWSTSARLTLANAGVIIVCFVLLLVVVVGLSRHYMYQHIRESVDSELTMLAGEFSLDRRTGLIELIHERMRRRSPYHARVYALQDADGRYLAGNLPRWPEAATGREGQLMLPSVEHPGETYVVTAYESLPDGSRLLVGFDQYELHHTEERLREGALLCLLVVLAMAWFAGRLITRISLRPIETIRASARQIMLGDLRHRVPLSGSGDEFDQLAETLNSMLDRIQQLISGVQGATDNIAHDLRSPLTRVRARLESVLAGPPKDEDWAPWVERHLADLDQVLSTFQALLQIARIDSGVLREHFTVCDLAELAREAVDFLEPLADARGQRLDVALPESLPLAGDRDLLQQLLYNLLDNAIKYAPEGSVITLTGACASDQVRLVLRDQGPGIPEAARERVFERLYRLDATRQTPGLGLGLSLVRAVVQLHHGGIRLDDGAPGLVVALTLPAQA